MFSGMSDRFALAATLIALFMTTTVCLWYAAIFLQPQISLNPFPPPVAVDAQGLALIGTPTQAVRATPTFPPTWTPTGTSTPTPTPTPTLTETPTETPAPTDTPTITPTFTRTPRPTRRPPPPPTATPPPPPPPTEAASLWKGRLVATWVNCGSTGLFGKVRGPGGAPMGDIWVHYWADGWDGAVGAYQGRLLGRRGRSELGRPAGYSTQAGQLARGHCVRRRKQRAPVQSRHRRDQRAL